MVEETHVNTLILLGLPSPSVYFAHTCMHLFLLCIQIYVCIYIYSVYMYINILKRQTSEHTDNDINRIFNIRKRK